MGHQARLAYIIKMQIVVVAFLYHLGVFDVSFCVQLVHSIQIVYNEKMLPYCIEHLSE